MKGSLFWALTRVKRNEPELSPQVYSSQSKSQKLF
jgi:hypothetical protein